MRPHIFALAFGFLAAGPCALAQSPDPAGASPGSSPAPAPCTSNCPQAPAKPATSNPDSQTKPPARPHKVYTNEDIDARPHDITIEGTRDILQQLNVCSRMARTGRSRPDISVNDSRIKSPSARD